MRERDRLTLQPGRVTVRHVKRGTAAEQGAVQVLDTWYVPQDRRGINGRQGWQSGEYERRLGEEGTLTLKLPNAAGADAVLHRERFRVLVDGDYAPGDEWFEVYWQGATEPEQVATPVRATVTPTEVNLQCVDAFWLLKKVRETSAGFNVAAPRDVFEAYTEVWDDVLLEDFGPDVVFSSSTPGGGTIGTTADGRFTYKNARSDPGTAVEFWPGEVKIWHYNPDTGYVQTTEQLPIDLNSHYRVETQIRLDKAPDASDNIALRLREPSNLGDVAMMRFKYNETQAFAQGQSQAVRVPHVGSEAGIVNLAIEVRGRWTYFFKDGRLISTQATGFVGTHFQVRVERETQGASPPTSYVRELIVRKRKPFLLRGAFKGDYRLPGAPPPGGLVGEYFNQNQRVTQPGTWANVLNDYFRPSQEPAARRVDAAINFSSATWTPADVRKPAFSVRWTGAIYLDLDNYDYRFQYQSDDSGRLWVGKTRFDQMLTEDIALGNTVSTSGWLKDSGAGPLTGQKSGWYPIVVEFGAGNTSVASAVLKYQRSDEGSGTWTVAGSDNRVQLSPVGVVNEHVRFDSHYERVRSVMESWGLQATCVPKQLESGEFPGRLEPKVRVGRDTEYVLSEVEATQKQREVNAEDVCDTLFADGAGISDESQITVERPDFDKAALHLFTMTEHEQLSDITFPGLLHQRVESLLALRGSPWEEVQAQPRGFRKLVDRFPLAGELAELKWEPGDGVRLDQDDLGVVDLTPRQMLGVTRGIVPDGLGAVNAAFRQRPRNLRETLRRMQRQALLQGRQYQGQLVAWSSNWAARNDGNIPDANCRGPMPADLSKIVRWQLIVGYKSGTGSYTVQINATDRFSITKAGVYDITEYAQAYDFTGAYQQSYVLLHSGGGAGVENVQYHTEVTHLI